MARTRFPQVRLLENKENVGFARANNQVFQLAGGRHVLLLNSDTVVPPGALHKLVQYLDENAQVGVVGPMLLNPDGTFQRSCWRGFPSLRYAFIDAFYLWRLAPRSRWVRSWKCSAFSLVTRSKLITCWCLYDGSPGGD
jgi:GT2 family glycosyltransferase